MFDILLCYLYVPVRDTADLEEWFVCVCADYRASGRILISDEGINVNIGVPTGGGMEQLCRLIDERMREECVAASKEGYFVPKAGIDFKVESNATESDPFPDLKIKVCKELVASGNIDLKLLTRDRLGGKHITAEEFHNIIEEYRRNGDKPKAGEKELVIIDVRNRKEIEFGRFEGSVSSDTKMFSEWPAKFADANAEQLKDKQVLMYCTGGVRCEKASAYLRSHGVDDVSQLDGGIFRYLERYGSSGYFFGSNMVFDARGLQTPAGASVVSKCPCGVPNAELSGDRVCAVCRDAVIVCDPCRKKKLGVYFCSVHENLEGVYFPFLEHFSTEDLQQQIKVIEKLCQSPAFSGKSCRNQRRKLNKQVREFGMSYMRSAPWGFGLKVSSRPTSLNFTPFRPQNIALSLNCKPAISTSFSTTLSGNLSPEELNG